MTRKDQLPIKFNVAVDAYFENPKLTHTDKEKIYAFWKLIDEFGTKNDVLENHPELKTSRNPDNYPILLSMIRAILEK